MNYPPEIEEFLAKYDRLLLDEQGIIKLHSADFYKTIDNDDLRVWCICRAIYQLPTVELVQWLKDNFSLDKAIEIGAGNNYLYHHLGISGLPKSCYYNCFQLLKDNLDLTYCEGYALYPDLALPLIHAWLIDEGGQVIDPTWDESDTVYLGVPFDAKWFIELLRSRDREDCLAVFESNYMEDFSLLKEGLPSEAIALSYSNNDN